MTKKNTIIVVFLMNIIINTLFHNFVQIDRIKNFNEKI